MLGDGTILGVGVALGAAAGAATGIWKEQSVPKLASLTALNSGLATAGFLGMRAILRAHRNGEQHMADNVLAASFTGYFLAGANCTRNAFHACVRLCVLTDVPFYSSVASCCCARGHRLWRRCRDWGARLDVARGQVQYRTAGQHKPLARRGK